jgi:hypothetical protein
MINLPKYYWACLIALFLSNPVLAATPVGQILFSKGQLHVIHQGQTQTATRGSKIWLGDTLITGNNSRALLRFADGTRTTLGDNTEYQIQTFSLDQTGQSRAVYKLVKGVFKTVTGAIASNDKSHQVETALGTIGIRGTTFWGGYLVADKLDVLLIDGEHAVVVSNALGSQELNRSGEGTTLSSQQPPGPVKNWPQAKVDRAYATVAWPELPEFSE